MINKVLTVLALPLVVFLGGAWLMSEMSNRDYVLELLNKSNLPSCEKKPLNKRLGYDIDAVTRYWNAFDATALNAERFILELDLVFPFFYGAAFGISLLLTWAMIGRPFSPLWIIVPVAITILADWTENLIQLHQLKQYREHGAVALQANLIQIASLATCTKLIFFCALVLFLLALVFMMFRVTGVRREYLLIVMGAEGSGVRSCNRTL
jgi:hypothetical protein